MVEDIPQLQYTYIHKYMYIHSSCFRRQRGGFGVYICHSKNLFPIHVYTHAIQKHPGCKKARPSWNQQLMFDVCLSGMCD